MWLTCEYALHMSKMIQIRNVPDELHRRLKVRAAQAGMTLSDFLLAELRRSAEHLTPDELWQRIRSRPPVQPKVPVAEAIRHERDSR